MTKKAKKKFTEAAQPVAAPPSTFIEHDFAMYEPQVNFDPKDMGCPDEITFQRLYKFIISDWDVDTHRHMFTSLRDWVSITLYYLKEGVTQDAIGGILNCTKSTIGHIIHDTVQEMHPHWTKMIHKMAMRGLKESNHLSLKSHLSVVFPVGHSVAVKFPLYLSEVGGVFGFPTSYRWHYENRIFEDNIAFSEMQSGDIVLLPDNSNLKANVQLQLVRKGVCIFHETPTEGDTPQFNIDGFRTVRDLVTEFYGKLMSYQLFKTYIFTQSDYDMQKLAKYLAVVTSLLQYYESRSKEAPTPLNPTEWLKYKMRDIQAQLDRVSDQLRHKKVEEEEEEREEPQQYLMEEEEGDVGDILPKKEEEENSPSRSQERRKYVTVEGHMKPIAPIKFSHYKHHLHWNKANKKFHTKFGRLQQASH